MLLRPVLLSLLLAGCAKAPEPVFTPSTPTRNHRVDGYNVWVQDVKSDAGVPCVVVTARHGVAVSCDWSKP